MQHEISLHEQNTFLTLTYDDENVPSHNGLEKTHLRAFVKALRQQISPKKISFYGCGEYGEQHLRPHYHILIFGHDFTVQDRELIDENNGNPLYTHPDLERLWKKGTAYIGEANYDTAGYTARYITKKITGEQSHDHYRRFDTLTGEDTYVEPEFASMSRRPSIGLGWFEKYSTDVYPSDEIIIKGKPSKPPTFYDRLHERSAPESFENIKRIRRNARNSLENTFDRLAVRKTCKLAQITSLKRNL